MRDNLERRYDGIGALAGAFCEMRCLTALHISGNVGAMQAVLEAAAASPALRSRLELLELPDVAWAKHDVDIAGCVRPFAALRCLRASGAVLPPRT